MPAYAERCGAGGLVTDFNPLRLSRAGETTVADRLSVPLHLVDAHNVVPVWRASDKQEYAARTIRPKLQRLLPEFLTDLPAMERHAVPWAGDVPAIDWDDAALEHKLGVVAATILQVNDGRGPDIVALQEVENIGILERLRTEYLGAAGYKPGTLIEGDDLRGIDVAFLTRLDLAEPPTLHRIDFSGVEQVRVYDTRGILEATFVRPDGSLLTGYSVHFPAPFHPTEMREAAYRHLNALRSELPPDRDAFAAGDFNTTALEDREQDMLERFVRPYWTVAHEVGCAGCKGTSYYAPRDDWSFLDMILWSPAEIRGENATWDLRADSVRIANAAPGQKRADGTPRRFEMPGGSGVSDHWPVVVTIESK